MNEASSASSVRVFKFFNSNFNLYFFSKVKSAFMSKGIQDLNQVFLQNIR